MRALLVLCLSATLITLANAQVRPDQFPVEQNPTDANFEIYSQKNGSNTRTTPSLLRRAIAPRIVDVTVTPPAVGNVLNRMELVRTPTGEVWYIDYLGRALRIERARGALYVRQAEIVNGVTILATIPMPADPDDLEVLRTGVELTRGIDYTITGNTITLTYPASSELFKLKAPL